MALEQKYTIFRTEEMKRRKPDGTLVPHTHVSTYPGFGKDAKRALDEVMNDTAINESDLLCEMPLDDPDYDMEMMMAVERLSGTWTLFAGKHKSPPKETALLRA